MDRAYAVRSSRASEPRHWVGPNVSRPAPAVVFDVAFVTSTIDLGYGMKSLPVGTADAIRVGTGVGANVTYAVATGEEGDPAVRCSSPPEHP